MRHHCPLPVSTLVYGSLVVDIAAISASGHVRDLRCEVGLRRAWLRVVRHTLGSSCFLGRSFAWNKNRCELHFFLSREGVTSSSRGTFPFNHGPSPSRKPKVGSWQTQ